MPLYIYLLIILALATTAAYFRGRNKNRWISGWIAEAVEAALSPTDTNYINIGGSIGYNFIHKLKKPFTEAKGTYTLLPRQSLLYLPVSLLVSRHDRFYMNIFTKKKLPGEAHIIRKNYMRKMRSPIEGIERMNRAEASKDGTDYILLWDRPGMESTARAYLENGISGKNMLHFCCYSGNKTFFIHMTPADRDSFCADMKKAVKGLELFLSDNAESAEIRGETARENLRK